MQLEYITCNPLTAYSVAYEEVSSEWIQANLAEKSSDNFIFLFLVLNLFYSFTEGSNGLFKGNYTFAKFQRGSTFSRGAGGGVGVRILYHRSGSAHESG